MTTQEKSKKGQNPFDQVFLPSQGFFLVSSLIAVAIAGMLLTTMLSMFSIQSREGKASKQKLDGVAFQYALLHVLKNPSNCLCQFESHTIDTTKATPGRSGNKIVLTEFKSSCGGALIAENQELEDSHLQIESIEVIKIKATGTIDEYFGDLVVTYKSGSAVRALDFTIPLQFTIDPHRGSPEAREIRLCGAASDVPERLAQLSRNIFPTKNQIEGEITHFQTTQEKRVIEMETDMEEKREALDGRVVINTSHLGNLEKRVTYLEFKKIYDEAVVELNNAMAISCPRLSGTTCTSTPGAEEDDPPIRTCTSYTYPDTACLNRRAAAIAVATIEVNKAKADMDNAKAQINDF